MEVSLSPEIEKKLNDIAAKSGRPPAAIVEDAIVGYVDELAETSATRDRRYDEIKSGKVKLIPGEEIEAYFREKYAADQRERSGS